jgi:hypothetical protein
MPPPIDPTSVRARLTRLLAECRDDPAKFNHVFLKRAPYWWRQVEICRSLVRYKTTVVVSGNATGKDYIVGGIVPWWLWTRHESLIFATGPSQTVLGTVTWKEIRKAIDKARFPMGGRVSQGAKASPLVVDLGCGWQALGYSTTSIERASGQHEKNLLVIVEEASGVDDEVFEAIRGLNPAKLLVIGNPLKAGNRYHKLYKRALKEAKDPRIPDDEKVNAVVIPSTDSPDIHLARSLRGLADRGFLDEAEREYGRDSLWWLTHVLAQFPDASHDGLLKPDWVDRMGTVARCTRSRPGPRWMSVDLGEGVGRDRTVIMIGDSLGILYCEVKNDRGIPEAAVAINRLMQQWGVGQDRIVYDAGGRGKDLPRFLEQFNITEAIPYHGGTRLAKKYTNKRSKMAWKLRQRLDPRRPERLPDPTPEDEDARRSAFYVAPPEPVADIQPPFTIPPEHDWWPSLEEELKALRYSQEGDKIALELKEDMARALGRSPDILDALLMSFALEDDD